MAKDRSRYVHKKNFPIHCLKDSFRRGYEGGLVQNPRISHIKTKKDVGTNCEETVMGCTREVCDARRLRRIKLRRVGTRKLGDIEKE